MIYVMSDIHGCYEKYLKMLDEIKSALEKDKETIKNWWERGQNG